MTKYARIIDNKVIETFIPPTGFGINGCFHPSIAKQFVIVPDEVEQNWTKDSKGRFFAPVVVVQQPEDSIPE